MELGVRIKHPPAEVSLMLESKKTKLVSKEDLAACQVLARAKIPSLLEDIEQAPARDPRTRYRFFGYLAAYLSSIYGHRTGVLTRLEGEGGEGGRRR